MTIYANGSNHDTQVSNLEPITSQTKVGASTSSSDAGHIVIYFTIAKLRTFSEIISLC